MGEGEERKGQLRVGEADRQGAAADGLGVEAGGASEQRRGGAVEKVRTSLKFAPPPSSLPDRRSLKKRA